MVTVTANILKDHYKTVVTAGKNFLIADEPVSENGTESGFSASELLIASLGACTSVTLRMYADRRNWPLEEVTVHLMMQSDKEKKSTSIIRNIELKGALTEDQRTRLLAIANKCPVHQVLMNPIIMDTKLI